MTGSAVALTVKSSRLIIGVDPGKVTGLAWLLDDVFRSTDATPMDACAVIDDILHEHRPGRHTVIAVERYNITAQTVKLTRQYDALEVIGACRWLAYTHVVDFLVQAAGEAQRCGNRDVLRTLGWWKPGGDHLNKAAAQVALAYQRILPHEFASLLEPGMIN